MGRLTRYGCDHRGRPIARHPRVLRAQASQRRRSLANLRALRVAEAARDDALALQAAEELELAELVAADGVPDDFRETYEPPVTIDDDDGEPEFDPDDFDDEPLTEATRHVRPPADLSRFIAAMRAKPAPAAPIARVLEPAPSRDECRRCGVPGFKGCDHWAPYQADHVALPDGRARPRGAYVPGKYGAHEQPYRLWLLEGRLMLMRNASTPCPRQPALAGDKNPRERTKGEQLLAEIEAFLRRNPHWSQHRFGREACANPLLVTRLQEGTEPQDITCRRVRKVIAENGG